MKKIIFASLLILLLSSCSGLRDDLNDLFTEDVEFNWVYPGEPITEISDLRDALRDLNYISDGDIDNWQLPDITWERCGGDCEDLSSISAYILKQEMGLEVKLAVLKLKSGHSLHMTPMIDGELYLYFGFQYDYPEYDLLYTMSLDDYIQNNVKRSINSDIFGGELGPELKELLLNKN